MANKFLDPNISLRILIVDPDSTAASRVTVALSRIQVAPGQSFDNKTTASIPQAYEILLIYRPNVIFLDLVSTGIRDSITFIQHVRITQPAIVFVLYCEKAALESYKSEIYLGWGTRLKHYFLLQKDIPDSDFDEQLLFNLMRVQLDLYAYGTHESLSLAQSLEGTTAFNDIQISKLQTQVFQLSRDVVALARLRKGTTSLPRSKRAFTIMALTEDMTDIYELGIKEHLEKFGIEVCRADEQYSNGLIIQRIYEEIHNSTIVIADLTHPRPNCYYELGFADAINKQVVRLARTGTQIPFDVNQYPFIFYKSVSDLRTRLSNILNQLEVIKL